jgi:hypothetical protein
MKSLLFALILSLIWDKVENDKNIENLINREYFHNEERTQFTLCRAFEPPASESTIHSHYVSGFSHFAFNYSVTVSFLKIQKRCKNFLPEFESCGMILHNLFGHLANVALQFSQQLSSQEQLGILELDERREMQDIDSDVRYLMGQLEAMKDDIASKTTHPSMWRECAPFLIPEQGDSCSQSHGPSHPAPSSFYCRASAAFDQLHCLLAALGRFESVRTLIAASLGAALDHALLPLHAAACPAAAAPPPGWSPLLIVPAQRVARLPVLRFAGNCLVTYGHVLLDNLLSLHAHLAQAGLLSTPLVLRVADLGPWAQGLPPDAARAVFEQAVHAATRAAAVQWLDRAQMEEEAAGGGSCGVLRQRPGKEVDPGLRGILADAAARFNASGASRVRARACERVRE